jgi:hypothetical protein
MLKENDEILKLFYSQCFIENLKSGKEENAIFILNNYLSKYFSIFEIDNINNLNENDQFLLVKFF